ncbi:MAG: ATP-binding cassette domain-containing protein [Sandaracinaceae bacterium]|nr:ATP-binding cassette domain-containing protein [Sandaracinaceae bacterium]
MAPIEERGSFLPRPPGEAAAAWLGDWEALLRRVDGAVGLDVDLDALRAIADRTSAEDRGPWPQRLVAACEELGLHATHLEGSVADIARAVGPEHPVVALDVDGRWVLLTDRRGRQLEVERRDGVVRWASRGELAELLDPAQLGAVTWVAVDPPGLLHDPDGAADDAEGSGPPPSPWARLRLVLRQERHDVLVTLVYAIGVGLLTLATPIAVQALVNTVAFGTLLQPLAVLAILVLLGLAFAGVLRALQAWIVEVLQRRLFVRLVNDLSHRLPRVELSAFDRAHGPELVNRFFDLFTIQKAASSLLIDGLQVVLTAAVGMLVLAFYHPLLLAFDVVLLGLVAGILFGLGRGATATAVKESKAKYEVASWLEEVARHPSAFRLAGGPTLARQRADELAAAYLTGRDKHFRVVFRQLAGALALQAFASAGVLGIGGWLVIERQLTLGQLVAAELIVTMVVASFAKIGKHLETTYDLLAALDKVGQLLDLPLEPCGPTTPLPAPGAWGAKLEARGLSFAFEGREPLFTDVSLELAPGDRAVLAGVSGAGRTALVDVLLGLRTARAGSVQIDGLDLGDVDRQELRERAALVRGAEVVVGTIADNVAFGRRHVDAAQVRAALRAVDLLDEIAALPEGLATRVMPDGGPLSRGQAQRLVIARAIVGRPSLLVIDGALDGLDAATRDGVLDVLFAADAPWTLLVVTDDPAIRRRATRALALRDGCLFDTAPTEA